MNTCDECGSRFTDRQSPMADLCTECSHVLYAYPACDHTFASGICTKCGWNGKRSAYVKGLLDNDAR